MAFTTGLNININLRPLHGIGAPPRSFPDQNMLMTALVSLAALLQDLGQGCSPLGLCRPSFGNESAGARVAPGMEGFLGGQNPSRAANSMMERPSGPGEAAVRRSSTLPRSPQPPTTDAVHSADGPDRLGAINVESLVEVLPPSRRESARTHFPIIIDEARRQGIQSRAQLAYILATANHESGAGRRMVEIASGEAYENRRGLGNTEPGDGPRFRGRGYVQITGRSNYTAWSRRLGMDLVGQPSLAERPDIAARILVGGMREGTFTRRRLDHYINDQRTDFDGARRTIGGGRGAERVSEVAERLLAAMGSS